MSFSYTIRESISGFRRTRLSTLISIITISISLLFLGMFAIASLHTAHFIEVLRGSVEIEAFLEEPLTSSSADNIRTAVGKISGVREVTYVTKEEAARIFQREFGENVLDVLEFNPLPASLKISLADGYTSADKANGLARAIEDIDGIESVRYRKELLELIDARAASINNLTLGLGIIISLSAIFLVSNTIRLTIYAKRHIIRTMELVGATQAFIRIPFLLEGIIQGILGGIVASGILYLLLEYALRFISIDFSQTIHREPYLYAALLAAGALLGLVGGIISVVRFINRATAA